MQFIHSMKVVEVVKPRITRMTAEGVKCIFSFSPLSAFSGFSKGGKGRKHRAMPSTMMITAVARNTRLKGRLRAATNPMAKGNRNWAMEIDSLVKMLAMVPFSLKISMQEGVMLVSRKEFAMPLMMAMA